MSAATDTSNKAKVTTPGDREVATERIFHAPRSKVWRAYSEPELIKQWWGRGNPLVIERFEFERATEERDGMISAGMESGLHESYAALDRLLATL